MTPYGCLACTIYTHAYIQNNLYNMRQLLLKRISVDDPLFNDTRARLHAGGGHP